MKKISYFAMVSFVLFSFFETNAQSLFTRVDFEKIGTQCTEEGKANPDAVKSSQSFEDFVMKCGLEKMGGTATSMAEKCTQIYTNDAKNREALESALRCLDSLAVYMKSSNWCSGETNLIESFIDTNPYPKMSSALLNRTLSWNFAQCASDVAYKTKDTKQCGLLLNGYISYGGLYYNQCLKGNREMLAPTDSQIAQFVAGKSLVIISPKKPTDVTISKITSSSVQPSYYPFKSAEEKAYYADQKVKNEQERILNQKIQPIMDVAEKNRVNTEHESLKILMPKVGYSCDTRASEERCEKIVYYAQQLYVHKNNQTEFGMKTIQSVTAIVSKLSVAEQSLVKKLEPYMPEWNTLAVWRTYDKSEEVRTELLKIGITDPKANRAIWPKPKLPRPDGTYSLPMQIVKEKVITSRDTASKTESKTYKAPEKQSTTSSIDIPSKGPKLDLWGNFIQWIKFW